MANREITYYSLLSSENLRHVEQLADTMDEQSFVELGFEQKWFHHLWIVPNNEAFLEYIKHQTDYTKLDMILGEQLKLYSRKKGIGYEQNKGDFHGTYKARKDWLNHTIFICKNEYNKTQNEVFNEVVKWCVEWQGEWLETFNPYSPTELKEMSKDLKKPLWEQLNEGEPPNQIKTKNETIRYRAKHYVLTYLFECNAKGESFPIGQKKELEKIGNKKMGVGKGKRFYKVFNEIVSKDINTENTLIEIGGENWRNIVKDLSNNPEKIEKYLQSKQL